MPQSAPVMGGPKGSQKLVKRKKFAYLRETFLDFYGQFKNRIFSPKEFDGFTQGTSVAFSMVK
jgi:hypothetical protein